VSGVIGPWSVAGFESSPERANEEKEEEEGILTPLPHQSPSPTPPSDPPDPHDLPQRGGGGGRGERGGAGGGEERGHVPEIGYGSVPQGTVGVKGY